MAHRAIVVLEVRIYWISLGVSTWWHHGIIAAMDWRFMNGSFWIDRSYVDVDQIGL